MSIPFLLVLSTAAFFILIWFGIVVFLRSKKGKDLMYLLFFSVFYVYMYEVLD